ncbi:MAG: lipase [Candidatus Melainabacteria bacterium]|nr:MAG: lipase [Candidatus Melainabacteria bacterium]
MRADKALLLVLCLTIIFGASACRHKHRYRPQPVAFGNLAYGPNTDNGANLLDLYLPVGKGPYPLVVCIHGGGWESGDKAFFPFRELVRNGFAVASINYRLSAQAAFPAQIIDCKLAIGWLRLHAADYDLDPDAIGIWGMSAGGHLAALAGLTGDMPAPPWASPDRQVSNHVAAVCDWCGPSDLVSISPQSGGNLAVNDLLTRLLGTTPASDPALTREASPVFYSQRELPPFLIMHGLKDPIVPSQQSRELNDHLKSIGADSTLILLKGANHGFYSPENEAKVIDFFERTLKAKRTKAGTCPGAVPCMRTIAS